MDENLIQNFLERQKLKDESLLDLDSEENNKTVNLKLKEKENDE